MKKLTVIAFVLLIGIVTTQAQVTVSPGLRGGLNLSRLTNLNNSSSKTNFYVGGLVEIKFNKYFTLQPELTYSKQGSKGYYYDAYSEGIVVSEQKKYELDYLSVGAVAKFHFAGSGFHILAGPSAEFKTSDNFNHSGTAEPINFDLAIVGGLGYTLPNGLTFEARLKHGLIDIYGYDHFNSDSDTSYYDDLVLNQVFQIGISYTFKVK